MSSSSAVHGPPGWPGLSGTKETWGLQLDEDKGYSEVKQFCLKNSYSQRFHKVVGQKFALLFFGPDFYKLM